MSRTATRWRKPFIQFLESVRIDSKEVAAVDEFGTPLNMWGSQRMMIDEICSGLENDVFWFLVLKARQLGISTITLALDIFWLLIHPGLLGALVTDTEGNRNVFRATIEKYIKYLPMDLVGSDFSVVNSNNTFLLLSNGSRLDYIVAGTKSKATWGEGRGYVLAHLTEIGNYGSASGLASFRETLAETHPHRLFIGESTAKGYNHLKDMWDEALRDTMTKRAIFIGWWAKELNRIKRADKRFNIYGRDAPNYREQELIDEVAIRHKIHVDREQLAWYRWRASDSSSSDQDREQNLPWLAEQAFVFTGFSFFQTRLVAQDMEAATDPDNFDHYRFKGYRYIIGNEFWAINMEEITEMARIDEVELRVWEEPVKDAQYVIGCDPAFGRNDWGDRSCASVWRCYADRLVQVAEFASADYETHQFAWVLAHIAGAYRNCIVNLELSGGPGLAVMREWESLRQRLRAEMYAEIVTKFGWEDSLNQARWYLYHRPDSMGAGYAYGWKSSRDAKFNMLNGMRGSYTTRVMWVRSRKLLEEMQTVIQDGGTIGAPGREKDDRVFGAGLANLAWEEWIRQPMIAQGLTYELISKREAGELGLVNQVVDRLVANYFKRKDEEADNPRSGAPAFLRERGLV